METCSMIAIDTETVGVDFFHGTKPFFITTCNSQGEQVYWEALADPLTREPQWSEDDVTEISDYLSSESEWVLHNSKFDIRALEVIGVFLPEDYWSRVQDSLLAGHLLASNQPHNLTDMVVQYLGKDILPLEEVLHKTVESCRRQVRSKLPDWRIARVGLREMPSAKGQVWKFDTWLPKALAIELGKSNLEYQEESNHPYHSVLRDYANMDSAVTIALWPALREEMEKRGLYNIYRERLKLLPIIYDMEKKGVTLSRERLEQLRVEYKEESKKAERVCVNIASGMGYELVMPKSGNSKSLNEFCFGRLSLPPLKRSRKTGVPSLDKGVLESYETILPGHSKQLTFVRSLKGKRARDTALIYMDGYERFWLPLDPNSKGEEDEKCRLGLASPKGEQERAGVSWSRELLDVDNEQVHKHGIWTGSETRGEIRTQDKLQNIQRGDSTRDERTAQMRQPTLCEPEPSVSGDIQGELTGYGKEGKASGGQQKRVDSIPGETNKRGATPHDVSNRTTGKRNKEAIQKRGQTVRGSGTGSDVRYDKVDNIKNSERTLLEACDLAEWYILHSSINPTGTDTLRMSSSNPNQQNISKREGFNLRYCFGPAPGREWWSLDYENIELRIPAYESGEQTMIELFEKPNDPPYFGSYHLLNISAVYPEVFWPIAEKKGLFKDKYKASYYQWGKNGGFCKQYGGGKEKTDATFHKSGAYELIDSKMPKMAALNQYYIRYADQYGYVETIPDKTVEPERGYPILCTRTEHGKVLSTVPLNYHVQSTACWCALKAMVRCQPYLTKLTKVTGKTHYMTLYVHDEIVFDFPLATTDKEKQENRAKIKELKRLMEMSGEDIGVPLTVGVNLHTESWSEGVSL